MTYDIDIVIEIDGGRKVSVVCELWDAVDEWDVSGLTVTDAETGEPLVPTRAQEDEIRAAVIEIGAELASDGDHDDFGVPMIDYGYDGYDSEFMCEGSALRAASATNPRNLPCPTCERPNRLTPADRARGYQCDSCADLAERGGY